DERTIVVYVNTQQREKIKHTIENLQKQL
ncbi:spermidine/putrescine ABC transporter ATP-binding protein, partial [Staphylococcus succinus]